MFNEIHYWDRLLFEIPHYVTDVYQRREELHNLKENVLLVVKDYNRSVIFSETFYCCKITIAQQLDDVYNYQTITLLLQLFVLNKRKKCMTIFSLYCLHATLDFR